LGLAITQKPGALWLIAIGAALLLIGGVSQSLLPDFIYRQRRRSSLMPVWLSIVLLWLLFLSLVGEAIYYATVYLELLATGLFSNLLAWGYFISMPIILISLLYLALRTMILMKQ
jgi:hypothetical protein